MIIRRTRGSELTDGLMFGHRSAQSAATAVREKSCTLRTAATLCAAIAVSTMTLAASAADVPWATSAASKPSAPAVEKEWAGVKFAIDKDEWRDTPRRHRYIHGCFSPSHLCMSMYLPPKELYRARFIEHMEGGSAGLDKMMTQPGWDWAFNNAFDDMGAYLVETNEGHWPDEGTGLDNPRELWIANAHGVRISRAIAEKMYAQPPERGYITGCSGGGMRSELGLVNAPDLFDGAVAQAGHGGGTILGWAAYSKMGMLLGNEGVAKLIDAADVGGSEDVFAGLASFESSAVSDFLRLGYPRDAITGLRQYWGGTPPVMLIKGFEGYYKDFWTKPGFEGYDDPEMLKPFLIETEATVERVLTGRELRAAGTSAMGIVGGRNPDVATYGPPTGGGDILDSKTAVTLNYSNINKLFMAKVTIETGPDAGKAVYVTPSSTNGLLQAYLPKSPWGFDNVKAGDKLKLENRDYVAFMFLYRHAGEVLSFYDFPELRSAPNHQMPELAPLLTTWNQPNYAQVTEGPTPSAKGKEGMIGPNQKYIYLSGTADEAQWPAYINTHLRKMHNRTGADTDNRLRMWWMEGVPHCSGPLTGPASTQRVNNQGFVAQALIDVMNWTERGVAPPASTSYRFEQNGLLLPGTAAERHGIQPIVRLVANGGARAEVAVGKAVTLTASAEVPPGAGSLVRAEWDFDGKGAWPTQEKSVSGPRGVFTATFTYDKAGTYFPAIRVASLRDGVSTNAAPVYNIARARVVVK